MTQDPTVSVNHTVKRNRVAVLRNQQRSFHALLRHVWQKSPFYRDPYSDVGIRESKLEGVALTDLPIIDKKL
jgi:phenylacetate-coenzyme A ligase PaaK-like adenylate-forming protein